MKKEVVSSKNGNRIVIIVKIRHIQTCFKIIKLNLLAAFGHSYFILYVYTKYNLTLITALFMPLIAIL